LGDRLKCRIAVSELLAPEFQFSREYARHFGVPPTQDAGGLRGDVVALVVIANPASFAIPAKGWPPLSAGPGLSFP
jgi:hypothetical protein